MHSVFCQHVATTLERGCFATPPEAAGFDTTGHGLPKLRSCEPFDGFLAVFVAPPNKFNWFERINSLAPPLVSQVGLNGRDWSMENDWEVCGEALKA